MKVIYFQDPRGNFGDELNRWLWPQIIGDSISGFGHHGRETFEENRAEKTLFYGIGTILDERMPEEPEKIVFGSGCGYGVPLESLHGCKVFFVRGRKTAESLGLPVSKALTDPAILLRRFFDVIPDKDRIHPVSFMPHHSSVAGGFWQKACHALNIHYIDPLGFDIESVVGQISASRLIIAEAMHGAIVADTFRVPWIPVSSVTETNPFKWQDWCSTLDLTYKPVLLTAIFHNAANSRWKAVINGYKLGQRKRQLKALLGDVNRRAMLSDEKLLNAHIADMELQVERLKNYLEQGNRNSHRPSFSNGTMSVV